MKGFKKDGKFRPTGNKSKSSLKKSDVRRKETLSTVGVDKLKKRKDESIEKSYEDYEKELDEKFAEEYKWSPQPEILGLDGKPLPKTYYTNTYAMGSPYLHKDQIGIPKVQPKLWYLTTWDDGLLGVFETKRNAVTHGEDTWHRDGEGEYHSDEGKFLTRGDKMSQEQLTQDYESSDVPFSQLMSVCQNCEGKRDRMGSRICESCESKGVENPERSTEVLHLNNYSQDDE